MTAAEIFQSLIHVAGLALVFGAGIPLLFSLGMRCMTGDPIRDDNGVVVGDTPCKPSDEGAWLDCLCGAGRSYPGGHHVDCPRYAGPLLWLHAVW